MDWEGVLHPYRSIRQEIQSGPPLSKTQLQDGTDAFTVYADIVSWETGIVGCEISGFCVLERIVRSCGLCRVKETRDGEKERRIRTRIRDEIAARSAAIIEDVPFAEATRTRYLNYALSVITSRALPDLRDGLKPVQRRILYAMWHDLHVTADSRHIKCAAVVGEVMKTYHPHGDQSIYDALVRMAQPFSVRETLIDGYGNFGSIDGDPPAAFRYTECRLTPIAHDPLERAARADRQLPAELCFDGRRTDRLAGAVPESCS